jgi:Ni/Co efflux regulator RcnB
VRTMFFLHRAPLATALGAMFLVGVVSISGAQAQNASSGPGASGGMGQSSSSGSGQGDGAGSGGRPAGGGGSGNGNGGGKPGGQTGSGAGGQGHPGYSGGYGGGGHYPGRDHHNFHDHYGIGHGAGAWHAGGLEQHGPGWWQGRREFTAYSGRRAGFYFAPGYGYHPVSSAYFGRSWAVGAILPPELRGYVVADTTIYGVAPAPAGFRWIFVDDGLAMIDGSRGVIVKSYYHMW